MATSRSLCYPHPKDAASVVAGGVPKGIHPTAGLAHNWAYDYMAHGGTPVLAVERGRVWKLSGHEPDAGVIGGDIYGWNTYLMTPDGVIYFYTHQGYRYVKVGDRVRKGQVIGQVGRWPHDPGRSHTHLGVTHPMGDRASRQAATNVARAPKVRGWSPDV
jgi:murein DD-endopeptidase MepM/ murein hydrolase activator NlpD